LKASNCTTYWLSEFNDFSEDPSNQVFHVSIEIIDGNMVPTVDGQVFFGKMLSERPSRQDPVAKQVMDKRKSMEIPYDGQLWAQSKREGKYWENLIAAKK
jgi:hypothetical protein